MCIQTWSVPWGQLSLLMHIPTSTQLVRKWASKYLATIQSKSPCSLFHHWFWWVCLPNPATTQITLSPVKAPSFSRWDWFLLKFIEWDSPSILLCFQKIFILYWNKLSCFLCFLRLFHILVLLFHKFFEPNRCFKLQMNSDICEGFTSPNYSWTFRWNCQHLFKKLKSDTMHKKQLFLYGL
jgi:hypothetical protein